jgi:hypothetical protein
MSSVLTSLTTSFQNYIVSTVLERGNLEVKYEVLLGLDVDRLSPHCIFKIYITSFKTVMID